MSQRLTISAAELRAFESNIIAEHLDHYTGRLVAAAEHDYALTVHAKTFTVAVGAAALLGSEAPPVVSRNALAARDGLEVVERAYPYIANRSVTDWFQAIDEAWQTVRYTPDAITPKDRLVVGHIELLEALRKHTAKF